MKKLILVCVLILVPAVLFTACGIGIKGEKRPESESQSSSAPSLDASDLPTVTDADGNVVDYTGDTESANSGDEESPYLSVKSLKDINQKAGTDIKIPSGLTVTNEEFDVDTSVSPYIAYYTFMYNNKDYTVAASRKNGAMLLNIYLSDGTALGGGLGENEPLPPTQYDDLCAARWFEDGVQYNMYASGVSLSEFKSVYTKVK